MRNGSGNNPVLLSRYKLEPVKAFQSAKSVDKMLQTFKKIEKLFDESDLGIYCWTLTLEVWKKQDQSPDQVLSFGNRALQIFISNDTKRIPCFGNTCFVVSTGTGIFGTLCFHFHKSSLYIAYICNLLASACRKLKRYDECLSYLNWANRNLSTLEKDADDSCCGNNCVLNTLLLNQKELFHLKHNMSRFDEAVIPSMKVLEILEKTMEEGCIQLGMIYDQLSSTYLVVLKYKEALPLCLKALEIYRKHLGTNSVEVARIMRHLVLVYNDLGEYEKALEQNQLSQDILKNTAPNSPEFFIGEGDTGYTLLGLGKYEEAIGVLTRVVSRTEVEDNARGLALVNMAKALYYFGKRAEAKKHMKTAQNIFEKKGIRPNFIVIAFGDMSVLYEKMNDFGKVTSLLTRALCIPSVPQKFLIEGSARLFSLISLSGKENDGLADLEDVMESLKRSFGPEHCEVGYAYKNLGATYLKLGQEHLAVKFMQKAKDIMDVTLGSHHLDSLKTSQTLAETYATLRSYDLAIEVQEKVVEGLKGRGPSEQENLDEAVSLLKKMKIGVGADSENFPVMNSECGFSEDGKVI